MNRFRAEKSDDRDFVRLGNNIIRTGARAMAPCPQCQRSGSTCIVRKGNKRCGPCTKKNMTCDGNFSQTTFDNLEKKKHELRVKCLQGRKLMRTFAQQLLLQEKQQQKIENQLAEINRRQDAMLDRESRALGEMDELVDPSEPDQQVMGFEDDFFLFDDPSDLSYGLEIEPLPSLGASSVGLSSDEAVWVANLDSGDGAFVGPHG